MIIYLISGIVLSTQVGISHDEMHEEQNWTYNKDLVRNFFNNNKTDPHYVDKYYGIGFQIISQPFQYFIKKVIPYFVEVDTYGAKLISKHPMVFVFYFVSGLFFLKILHKVTNNASYSFLGTTIYLIYPYLLGHSFFNPKDIPFLSIWLICTFLSCSIFEFYIKNNKLLLVHTFSLAFLTAFLLSIRISGILIFIQYFISLIIFFNQTKLSLKKFLNIFFVKLLFFVFCFFFIILLFYPVFWSNPLDIINATKFFGKFYHDVCTLTLGKCVKAQNIDSLYIPIWFLFKLPTIVLIGILLIPISEKKIFKNYNNNIYFGTILSSAFLIPLILIFNKVPMYDEVRQVLFLTPLLFLLGLISLYYLSKKISFILVFTFLIFFTYENFKIFPYQYTWFNLPARFLDIGKNFETEYWGISGKELSKKIISENKNNNKNICILVTPDDLVRPFLSIHNFNCFYPWGVIDSNLKRPFWAVQNIRNLKKSIPYKCKIIYQEKIKLTFYKKDLVAGNLLECN